MAAPTPSVDGSRTSDIDLAFRPRVRPVAVVQPVGLGAVAWADAERFPILLDPAARTLLEVFDGRASLQDIVADLEAELPDVDPGVDLGLGVLMTCQRLGLEGFLEDVVPVPSSRRPSALYTLLTDWQDPGSLDEDVSGGADRTLGLANAEMFAVRFPLGPVRVSSTQPELGAIVREVTPDRVEEPDGGLFLSLVAGDEQRVGRSFFTLYGPHMARLVVTADLEALLGRALQHLALPLWLAEEPGLWWHRFRTLIGPDGDAILMSPERLGQQIGLPRALERAGYTVVDSVLTPIDPTTLDVVLFPSRFHVDRGELSREDAGPAGRARISTIVFSHTDDDVTRVEPAVVTRALARSTELTERVDRGELLAGMAALASSRRVLRVGQATPGELIEELSSGT